MPTRREAEELQALAQVALPAVRRGRPLSAALPCKADRYRLRVAVAHLICKGVVHGTRDLGRAAVHYLARGGDPWP